MVQKRHVRDHDADERDPKRNTFSKTVGSSAWNADELEPYIRIWVREEVEKAIYAFYGESSRSRSTGHTGLELRFFGRVKKTTFTGSVIEPEDPAEPIRIVLFDSATKSPVESGPFSCAKLKFVVLKGDFNADDYTTSQFRLEVLVERKGKRPLLTGDCFVTLSDGVGYLGNVVITDNSSWTRSGAFRLGALIADPITGEVKEARSEAFVVKDHRGELTKKHHPPGLNDEVWRLEKVGKGGKIHKKLEALGVRTVEDFLRLLTIRDPKGQELGVTPKIWNAIVNHARNCVMDDSTFLAYHRLEHGVSVYFNSVYNVVGASFNGHFLPVDALNSSQKNEVEDLKRQAYRNLNALVPVTGLASTIAGPSRPLADPFNEPTADLLQPDFHGQIQDQYLAPVLPPVVSAPQPSNHVLQYQVTPQTNRTSSFSFEEFHLEFPPETSSFNFAMPASWSEHAFHFGPNNELLAAIQGLNPMRDRNGRARWSKIRTAVNVCFRFSAVGSCRAC